MALVKPSKMKQRNTECEIVTVGAQKKIVITKYFGNANVCCL